MKNYLYFLSVFALWQFCGASQKCLSKLIVSRKPACNMSQRTFFGTPPKATWGDKIHQLNEKLSWGRVNSVVAGASFAGLIYIYQEQKLMNRKAEFNTLKKELSEKRS